MVRHNHNKNGDIMPITRNEPTPLVMDKTLALRLGAQQIPFKGKTPLPLQPPRPTIIVQCGPASNTRSWLYWPVDPLVLDGQA